MQARATDLTYSSAHYITHQDLLDVLWLKFCFIYGPCIPREGEVSLAGTTCASTLCRGALLSTKQLPGPPLMATEPN